MASAATKTYRLGKAKSIGVVAKFSGDANADLTSVQGKAEAKLDLRIAKKRPTL